VLYIEAKEVTNMSHQKTSKRVGTTAAKILSNPRSSKAAKSAAGSALANRPHKKGK
jgi:hypothetical protein